MSNEHIECKGFSANSFIFEKTMDHDDQKKKKWIT